MKRGAETHLESSIPLILIAILAVFVAAKFNFIDCSSVPGLSLVCPAPQIRVAVIGTPSRGLENLLQSENFRLAGVQYMGNLHQDTVYPGVLNQMDILILQGEQTCDRTARRVISDKVKAGGKMIVIQDACTKVNDDNTVVGWDIGIGLLGDIMPVQIGGYTRDYEPIRKFPVSGTFKIIPFDHPIFPTGQKNFEINSYVVKVGPSLKVDYSLLALVDTGDTTTDPSYWAIVESKSLLAGKVLYFSYDPGSMIKEDKGKEMLLNTVLYLKGAKG